AGSKRSLGIWKRVPPSERGGEKKREGAVPQQEPAKEDKDKLQGTWRLASAENDGLRIGEGREEIKDDRLLIEKSSITFACVAGSPFTKPESIKAVADFSLDTKQPSKVIVLRWKKSLTGKEDFTQKAIYAVEGDTLKLCLYLYDENEKNPPTDFSANAGSKRAFWTFKREPAPGKAGQDDRKPTAGKRVEPAVKQGKEEDKGTRTAWGQE